MSLYTETDHYCNKVKTAWVASQVPFGLYLIPDTSRLCLLDKIWSRLLESQRPALCFLTLTMFFLYHNSISLWLVALLRLLGTSSSIKNIIAVTCRNKETRKIESRVWNSTGFTLAVTNNAVPDYILHSNHFVCRLICKQHVVAYQHIWSYSLFLFILNKTKKLTKKDPQKTKTRLKLEKDQWMSVH